MGLDDDDVAAGKVEESPFRFLVAALVGSREFVFLRVATLVSE